MDEVSDKDDSLSFENTSSEVGIIDDTERQHSISPEHSNLNQSDDLQSISDTEINCDDKSCSFSSDILNESNFKENKDACIEDDHSNVCSDSFKVQFVTAKSKSDDALAVKDELDFEAEREEDSNDEKEEGEEGEDSDDKESPKEKAPKEEGEVSEEEEEDALASQEPKTVCRFFNKGQCTWGSNCRFLHPGVSDKGNYNMFAPSKPVSSTEEKEENSKKEKPREVRRYVPDDSPFESAWERGVRYAKEMLKRASKRKETDADFEEKRFNLSVGQAELDRENDYYTRPASPVYKPVMLPDDVVDPYLDPYEKQAIRHFRGGHFENLEVRYYVTPSYMARGGARPDRSRKDKFEREVSERIPRKHRVPRVRQIPEESHYPKRSWQEEKELDGPYNEEAEEWADPWARRKTPPLKLKGQSKKGKAAHTPRSYSSGSSSHSSHRSSRSSLTSYSRSGSRSSHSSVSHSSLSGSSRSPSPFHARHYPHPGEKGKGPRRSTMPYIQEGSQQKLPPTGPFTRPPIPRRPVQQDVKDPKLKEIKELRGDPVVKGKKKKLTSRSHSRSHSVTPPKLRQRRSRSPSLSASLSHSSSRSRSRSHSASSSGKSHSSPSIKKRGKLDTKKGHPSAHPSTMSKVLVPNKLHGPNKPQVRITLKGSNKKIDIPHILEDEDSGESDMEGISVLKKRKVISPILAPEVVSEASLSPDIGISLSGGIKKKPSRREELLKQLHAVEDAIARKKLKLT